MARRPAPAAERRPAKLSAPQIRNAIPKLERRHRELQGVQIDRWDDEIRNRLDGLQAKVEDTLAEVFGADTLEYKRFNVPKFWLSVRMSTSGTPTNEWVEGYRKAIGWATTTLGTAVEVLKEKLQDTGESPLGRTLQAYQGLELHPEIDRAADALYRGGHYANAIEDAVKALNALVRLRSGVEDLDGSKLMQQVFRPEGPVLSFNALADQSDIDEQRGYMMMFSGAVAGLRNPRAHKLVKDNSERALEFIAFVSLLAKLLDGAVKVPPK